MTEAYFPLLYCTICQFIPNVEQMAWLTLRMGHAQKCNRVNVAFSVFAYTFFFSFLIIFQVIATTKQNNTMKNRCTSESALKFATDFHRYVGWHFERIRCTCS